jgi:hypothetical protein
MNTFLVIALAAAGTLAIFFLGEIFILVIVVVLTVFYAALFLFAPTLIDAIPDATKNVLIIAMMVGAVLSLVVGRGSGRFEGPPQGLRVKAEWLRTAHAKCIPVEGTDRPGADPAEFTVHFANGTGKVLWPRSDAQTLECPQRQARTSLG